ncbi:MAG: beta-propeller fold lactonase family protein [Verrucomicrobiaceae bacterium]|nr:beta-propeller fold lactonase family protein [Verrucomicrobiaceae bacterium]
MKRLAGFFLLPLSLTLSMAETLPFYIGTYTKGESKGIYRSSINLETGECTPPVLAVKTENSSFLAVHPTEKLLYAVNETGKFKRQSSGSVSAFQIKDNGNLKHLNSQPTQGAHPCHLAVDATGKHVVVANYSGGSVVSIPIERNGKLGKANTFVQHQGASVNRSRQEVPHAHSINLSPQNNQAFVADLGLDEVLVYNFDPQSGELSDAAMAYGVVDPGSGPRHLASHGARVYVINEMANTISVFHHDSDTGNLSPVQTISTLPPSYEGRSYTAEIVISADGRFVYGSNRGHDSIAIFKVTGTKGQLELLEIEPTQGSSPRNFVIDPTGRFLLAENQNSNAINIFRIDQTTGELDPTSHVVKVPSPVCVRFLP